MLNYKVRPSKYKLVYKKPTQLEMDPTVFLELNQQEPSGTYQKGGPTILIITGILWKLSWYLVFTVGQLIYHLLVGQIGMRKHQPVSCVSCGLVGLDQFWPRSPTRFRSYDSSGSSHGHGPGNKKGHTCARFWSILLHWLVVEPYPSEKY